jgi:hypothetical protein
LQLLFRIETSGITPSPLHTLQMPVPLQREQWPVPPHFLQVVIGMDGSKRALAGDGEPGASSRAWMMASSNKTDGVLARAQSWKTLGHQQILLQARP